jgi:hypothetical protein
VIGAILWFLVMPVHGSEACGTLYATGTLAALAAPVVGLVYSFFRRRYMLAGAAIFPFLLVIALYLLCFLAVVFDVQRFFTGRYTRMKKKAYDQEYEAIKTHLNRCKKGAAEAKKYYQEDANCLLFLQKQGVADENSFLVALAAVEKYYEDLGKKLQNI